MPPIKECKCRWCQKPIEQRAGAGRPKSYCDSSCADAHYNWERRRERRLARGESPDQTDVFGSLPLAASHGRKPEASGHIRVRVVELDAEIEVPRG